VCWRHPCRALRDSICQLIFPGIEGRVRQRLAVASPPDPCDCPPRMHSTFRRPAGQ
jgi:hypothetical protein